MEAFRHTFYARSASPWMKPWSTSRCPFAAAVWGGLASRRILPVPLPSLQVSLQDWWPDAVEWLPIKERKAANPAVMLVLRAIWLEHNARVYDANMSTIGRVLDSTCKVTLAVS